jgi:hypothetical protein
MHRVKRIRSVAIDPLDRSELWFSFAPVVSEILGS